MEIIFLFLVVLAITMILHAITEAPGEDATAQRYSPAASTSPGDEAAWSDDLYRFELRIAGGYRSVPTDEECLAESQKCWVPTTQSVEVRGRRLAGGYVYVGREMSPLSYGHQESDPALVNPSLPVGGAPDRQGRNFGYWPSYSDIPRESRSAYLSWLEDGRSDPEANIGYVFLFFYGLERRILFDADHLEEAELEVPSLVSEVKRLLTIYGDNHSFQNYARGLIDFATLKYSLPVEEDIELGGSQVSWRMPTKLKAGLGRKLLDREPIPAEWAFAWFMHHPGTSLRTPGRRCSEEFRQLFELKYRDRYGTGMKIQPNKTKLKIDYRAASSSLRFYRAEDPELPDVEVLQAPLKMLSKIAEEAQEELDSYSRWVGRYEEGESLEALSLLPPGLIRDRLSDEQEAILEPIESRLANEEVALVPVEELIRHWPTKKSETLYKGEARKLAEFLAGLGFGIEPDPRHGSPNPGRSRYLAAFRLEAGDQVPGNAYAHATLLLHLGAAVASADEEFSSQEEALLEEHLEETLDLAPTDRRRLRAHLRWLASEPPDFRGIRNRAKALTDEERKTMGRFLLGIAAADGRLDARELATLEKIYPLLGLEANDVHFEMHSLAAGGATAATEPVTVSPGEPSRDFRIPTASAGDAGAGGFVLDKERIEEIHDDSQRAAALLHTIFADDDSADSEPVATEEVSAISGPFESLRLGDGPTGFLKSLVGRAEWSRAAIDSLAQEHGVMAAGTIEIINERSFELWDEPLLEGADPIEINEYLVNEFLSEEAER